MNRILRIYFHFAHDAVCVCVSNWGCCWRYSSGLDSLDAVEVVMAIEEEFIITIDDEQSEKILTVADAVEFVSSHPQAK